MKMNNKELVIFLIAFAVLCIASIPVATATLTNMATYTIKCTGGGYIKDFTIDPIHHHLYMLLGNGILEVDDLSTGSQVNLYCTNTLAAYMNATTSTDIEFGNGLLFVPNQAFNVTYSTYNNTPLLNPIGGGDSINIIGYFTPWNWDFSFPQTNTGNTKFLITRSVKGGTGQQHAINYYPSSYTGSFNDLGQRAYAPSATLQPMLSIYNNYEQAVSFIFRYDKTISNRTILANGSLWGETNVTMGNLAANVTPDSNYQTSYFNKTTQHLFLITKVPTSNDNGITLIDYTTAPPVVRGTCSDGTPNRLVAGMRYISDTEIYLFYQNQTSAVSALKCDFSNPLNPLITNETAITSAIQSVKTFKTPYDAIYVAEGYNAGHATQISKLTGYTGGTPAQCGNAIVNTGEQCDEGGNNGACPAYCSATCSVNACSQEMNQTNITALGKYTTSAYQFKDIIIKYGIAYIIGTANSGTKPTLVAMANTNPATISSNTKKIITLQPDDSPLGTFYDNNNVLYLTENNTISQIYPTSGIFNAHNENLNLYQPVGNTTMQAIGKANQDLSTLCYYYTGSSIYQPSGSRVTLFNNTATAEVPSWISPNYVTLMDSAASCNAIIYDSNLKYAYIDAQTEILAINTTDQTLGQAYDIVLNPQSTLTDSPSSMVYDDVNLKIYRALGSEGVQTMNAEGNSITTTQRCKPSGTTYTTSVAKVSNDVYVATGYRTTQAGFQGILYFCTLNDTNSITPPIFQSDIDMTLPKAMKYDSNTGFYHIIGDAPLLLGEYIIYQVSTTQFNQTIITNQTQGTATFYNLVLDEVTHSPIASARVHITDSIANSKETSTDSNGLAIITQINVGDYLKTITKSGYTTQQVAVSFSPNEVINVTSYLSIESIPNPINQNTSNVPRNTSLCRDSIKNVYVCGMTTQRCTTNTDCYTGRCDVGGYCASFNWNLCDQAGVPRDGVCVTKYTFLGMMNGAMNFVLHNFGYFLLILIFIILIITLVVALRKK